MSEVKREKGCSRRGVFFFFTRVLEIADQKEGEKFYSYSIAVSPVFSRQYARCLRWIILIVRLFQRGKSFC